MDIIKRKRKMYLEGRKATFMEQLRHIDYQMDKCVENGEISRYMELRQEYTHIQYRIDSINCRLHNMSSSSVKYTVEERGLSSHFIVNF